MISWGGAARYKEKKNIKFRDLIFDIPDSLSFIYQIKEIFGDEIYKFKSKNKEPLIIDCGANVGVSVLYFKKLYENCKIYAFEADKKIFQYLEQNIKNNNANNIELHNKAIWIDDNGIYFASDGADGGHIELDSKNTQKIDSVALKNILLKHSYIDFLKIDIEGAENEVLLDCKDSLNNIQNIFIEYHQRHDKPQNLGEIINILDKANFRIYLENITKYKSPFLIESKTCEFELQINIFGRKIPK
ncbi:FkbM family methyltransferase [Helicobacter sp. MIT 99-5507]|uniref:FkbM family methyltransferase n=1 Tax=Helicobacter sp. MIT 99-5507 TaxID=152489 RepID=UPI0015F176DE|nr:FkbM family methyltransferase [Helicobacter sp. MIT 99-5507]